MVLSGKVAIVTGGSRGVGFQISRVFLENGSRVLAVSRDPSNLAKAQEELPDLQTLQGDVSLAQDVDRVAAWVQRNWGHLDILVNNAGIYLRESLISEADEAFEHTFRVNVLGPYLCTKRLLPLLLKSDDPRIINLGSSMGRITPDLVDAYGVTKASLHPLTIGFANDLRGRVPVNIMTPGWVETDMAPDAPGDPRQSAEDTLWLVTQPRYLTGKFFRDQAEWE